MENNFFQQNNDIFQLDEIKKANSLKTELSKYDFSPIEAVYSLLDDYFSTKDESSLQIAKNKLNSEKFNIKGELEKYNISLLSFDNTNENIYINNNNNSALFEIEIILRKIHNRNNTNIPSFTENNEENNNKYYLKLSNITSEIKIELKKYFDRYYKPILAITNLEACLEQNELKKNIIKFKNTNDTKIFVEINKIFEQFNSKKNLRRAGNSATWGQIQMVNIYLKNNFKEMKNISFKKLKENRIKKYCNSVGCFYDIKNFLEIGTETLYVENLKNEFFSGYLLKTYNIDICCLVKKISNNDTYLKRKNYVFITLENIFDLNQIILEVSNTHDILKDLKVNGIYIFKNLTCFIDENFNVKLGVIKLDSKKSTKIGLYYITDINEYNNLKIKNLFHMQFNHLITLTNENYLIRSLQKYLICINSLMYLNAHMVNNNIFYEGCIIGSDGTSSGFFLIEHDCVKNLFKFDAEFDNYIRNKLYQEKKYQLFPVKNDYNFNEFNLLKVYGSQVVIIGVPKMNRLMEMQAQEMYDSISNLKMSSDKNKEKRIEELLEFDTKLTKIEFSMINGSFSRKSNKLEKIPYIKSSFLFYMDDYLKLVQSDKTDKI